MSSSERILPSASKLPLPVAGNLASDCATAVAGVIGRRSDYMLDLASHSRVEAVRKRLHESAYPSIKHIDCQFDDGILVLMGRVPSFFEKQLAQEIVADLDGIEEVVNRVEVN